MIKWVAKLWGAEKWLVNNEIYCAKELILVNGYQCSLHYHKIKDETFYILEGEVEIEMGYRDKQTSAVFKANFVSYQPRFPGF